MTLELRRMTSSVRHGDRRGSGKPLGRALAATAMLAAGLLAGPEMLAHAQDRSDADAFGATAEDAYLYGFPMLVAYKVLYDYNVDQDFGAIPGPSTRSSARRASSRPPTPRSARPTATRPIRSPNSTSAPSRLFCACPRSSRAGITTCSSPTCTPTTSATWAVAPPATAPAAIWSPDPAGRATRRTAWPRCSGARRTSR